MLDAKRREKTIVNAVFERIHKHRLTKVGVGIGIVLALGRGGQPQLHGGGKVFQNAAPAALIIGPAPVALVHDDEVEEVWRVLAKIRRRFAVLTLPAHKGLEDGEEHAAVLGHLALFANVFWRNTHQRIFCKGRERVERLVRQVVAVCQKQDAWAACGLGIGFPILQIPAAVKQLPRQLKRNKGLARAGGQR